MENKEKDYQCCNRHELLDARRQLRKAGELAEAVLWKCIKSRQILGFKFRRQFSVGPYILDFIAQTPNWVLNWMEPVIAQLMV
mgnify:CR=1 FL=1